MESRQIFRVERFDNYIVMHSNNGRIQDALCHMTGKPNPVQFDKKTIRVATVAVFLASGEGRTLYGCITRYGGWDSLTTLPMMTHKWMTQSWASRVDKTIEEISLSNKWPSDLLFPSCYKQS